MGSPLPSLRGPAGLVLALTLSVACGQADADTAGGDAGSTDATSAAVSDGAGPVEAPETQADPAAAEAASADETAAPAAPVLDRWPDDPTTLDKALYAGSWSVKPPEGFERAWIDEAGLIETFTGRAAGRRRWAGMAANSESLPADALMGDRDGSSAGYIYSLVQRYGIPGLAPEEAWPDEDAVLHLRHRGRTRVWFDGEMVFDVEATPDGSWQHVAVPVTLTRGFDVVLVKVGRGGDLGPSFDVQLAVSAYDGSPMGRVSWNTMRPSGFLDDRVDPAAEEN